MLRSLIPVKHPSLRFYNSSIPLRALTLSLLSTAFISAKCLPGITHFTYLYTTPSSEPHLHHHLNSRTQLHQDGKSRAARHVYR